MNNIIISKLMIIIVIIIIYLILVKSFVLLLPFIIGWLISLIIEPLVNFLHKKIRLYRGLSSFISLIIFIVIGGVLLTLIGNVLISELTKLSNRLPQISKQLDDYIYFIAIRFHPFFIDIPQNLTESIINSLGNILKSLTSYIGIIVTSTFNFLGAIPNIFIFILVSLISAFFISKDKEKIYKFIKLQFPEKILKNDNINIIKNDLFGAILGYVKAQLILMLITFVESLIGLNIIGVSYSILIALGVAILDALPVFGSGSVYIPWAIFKLLTHDYQTALFIFILYIIITLVRQTLEPKILSTQIGLYPLVTLVSIYVGLKIFGFLGIILGPLFVITFIALQKTGLLPKWKKI